MTQLAPRRTHRRSVAKRTLPKSDPKAQAVEKFLAAVRQNLVQPNAVYVIGVTCKTSAQA